MRDHMGYSPKTASGKFWPHLYASLQTKAPPPMPWTHADDLDCARREFAHAVRFWRRWHTRASRHRVRQALAYLRKQGTIDLPASNWLDRASVAIQEIRP